VKTLGLMNKSIKHLTSDQGFTVVEIILAIVIIGIIAVLAVPKYVDIGETAREKQCAANRASVASAMSMTYAAVLSNDPSQDDWLENAAMADVSDSMFVSGEIPTCPSEGVYTLTNGVVTCSVH